MFRKIFFVALIVGLFAVNAFAVLIDRDSVGTNYRIEITQTTVMYTVNVGYTADDSTMDLHTKAFQVSFWNQDKPMTVQIWTDATPDCVTVTVDAEFSSRLDDVTFLTSSVFDLTALGDGALVSAIFVGTPIDSTGVPRDEYAFLSYLRFECDGQTANSANSNLWIKITIPVIPGLTEPEVRTLAGIANTF